MSCLPGVAPLPARSGVRAVLDQPTGTLLVDAGRMTMHGAIEDVERFAADLISACWEARRVRDGPAAPR